MFLVLFRGPHAPHGRPCPLLKILCIRSESNFHRLSRRLARSFAGVLSLSERNRLGNTELARPRSGEPLQGGNVTDVFTANPRRVHVPSQQASFRINVTAVVTHWLCLQAFNCHVQIFHAPRNQLPEYTPFPTLDVQAARCIRRCQSSYRQQPASPIRNNDVSFQCPLMRGTGTTSFIDGDFVFRILPRFIRLPDKRVGSTGVGEVVLGMNRVPTVSRSCTCLEGCYGSRMVTGFTTTVVAFR